MDNRDSPDRITFTGADKHCAVDDLIRLVRSDPRIELAFLFSAKRAGQQNRYPTVEWIKDTSAQIEREAGFGRLALHLCGAEARDPFLAGEGCHGLPLWRFERIQINGRIEREQASGLRRMLDDVGALKIITQFDQNPPLHDWVRKPGHQVLFDASGGRGIAREEWPRHLGDWTCGYAGGLGPHNLSAELPRIAAAARPNEYWIDMESSLRDEGDRFSVEIARQALAAVRLWECAHSSGETKHGG